MARIPTSEPSTDKLLPFQCSSCGQWFGDYPALIVVVTSEGDLRYCTDDCADEHGWASAIAARWAQETSGGGLCLTYRI